MSLDAHNLPLSQWINRIDTRTVVLPRFQRFEAWSNREISDLLLTVLRGLPAGSLLTQHVSGQPLFNWRPLQNAPDSGDHITALLLDGQQRLTALWRSLTDNYENRTFFVYAPDADFEISNIEVRAEALFTKVNKSTKEEMQYPVWAKQPAECWNRKLIPLRLLHPSRSGSAINSWALEACGNDALNAMTLAGHINDLKAKVASFNLPFLELPANTPRDVVLDVFVKLNTRSVRLTAFDIIVAQVEDLDESLHQLVENVKKRVPRLLDFDDTPEDIILSTACLLQDRVPNQTGYFGLDLSQMIASWDDIERGIEAGVDFLESERIWDGTRLPTEAPLPLLFALWSIAPTQPDKLGNFRHLMSRYLWRSFFTGRYEQAAATAAFQDFRGLRDFIQGTKSISEIPIFDDVVYPLPTKDALINAAWPRGRQRLARAVLLLSLRGDALDVADAASIDLKQIKLREYHHLFPVDYLKGLGIPESQAMRALNCALISWRTNRTISNKSPKAYLEERIKGAITETIPPEDAIRHRLSTHGISLDSLSNYNYVDFLEERAIWAEDAVAKLCSGHNWRP